MTMPNTDKTLNKLLDHDILSVQPMTTPDYDLVNFWYTKEEIYEKFGVPYVKEKSKITPEESVCASPMNAPCGLEFKLEFVSEIERRRKFPIRLPEKKQIKEVDTLFGHYLLHEIMQYVKSIRRRIFG